MADKKNSWINIGVSIYTNTKYWYNTEADIYSHKVYGTEMLDIIQRLIYISIQYTLLKWWYNTEADIYFNTVYTTEMMI